MKSILLCAADMPSIIVNGGLRLAENAIVVYEIRLLCWKIKRRLS